MPSKIETHFLEVCLLSRSLRSFILCSLWGHFLGVGLLWWRCLPGSGQLKFLPLISRLSHIPNCPTHPPSLLSSPPKPISDEEDSIQLNSHTSPVQLMTHSSSDEIPLPRKDFSAGWSVVGWWLLDSWIVHGSNGQEHCYTIRTQVQVKLAARAVTSRRTPLNPDHDALLLLLSQ